MPCDKNGQHLNVVAGAQRKNIAGDLFVDFEFSRKPPEGYYLDYHQKISTYVSFLESHAQAIDCEATAKTWCVRINTEDQSPFQYLDSASSRAGISSVNKKLNLENIAILGLGGTGSYTLDLVAKTPVRQIHLFDGDKFGQHNAFRSPGAPSIEDLHEGPYKVDYWARIYGRIHKRIIPHRFNINLSNLEYLDKIEFAFICADAGSMKKVIIEKLEYLGIPFIDAGMGLDLVDDKLHGTITVTTSSPARREHFRNRVSLNGDGHENIYAKNIQIADLNALNAAMAVIKWKKIYGFYNDFKDEHFSAYTLDGNSLISEERGQ